jgi:hypothetical protein
MYYCVFLGSKRYSFFVVAWNSMSETFLGVDQRYTPSIHKSMSEICLNPDAYIH